MGAFAAFVEAHGSSLRQLASDLGVAAALLIRVDVGDQPLPDDLVSEVAGIFKVEKGDVQQVVGRVEVPAGGTVDLTGRHPRVPVLIPEVGTVLLSSTKPPKLLVLNPPPAENLLVTDLGDSDPIVTDAGPGILVGT